MRLSSIAGTVVLLAIGTNAASAQQASSPFVINSIQLQGILYDPVIGQLTATGGTVSGTLAGIPFTAPITKFVLGEVLDDLATEQVECSVLDLELGPINLALLGLHVDTSPICLSITAFEDQGLLGDLLCALAGGNLGLLGSRDLTGGLQDILNEALSRATPGQGQSVCTGQCVILNLAVGPLDLDLLGVNVHLDDCDDGPVRVCVSASRGEGILGNLLCGLTNTQILNLTLADIAQLASRALALAADGNLSQRDIGELTALLARLVR